MSCLPRDNSDYRKVPKFLDARKVRCNLQTDQTLEYFVKKDTDRIANSADPDQTAPLGAV